MTTNTTDRDRLREAFRALRADNITARMNFSCCGSCGHYELSEASKGRGYVFYHRQEAARLVDGKTIGKYGLWLQWGGGMDVAADIVAALKGAGLNAVLPPDESTCIHIEPTPKPADVRSELLGSFGL